MWLVATVLDSEAVSYEGGDFVVLTAVGLDDVWQRAGAQNIFVENDGGIYGFGGDGGGGEDDAGGCVVRWWW